MTATAEPPTRAVDALPQAPVGLGEGVDLLGAVHGSGYREGAALVRRGDGQMVQLGPLMYELLECVDGRRDNGALATALSERLGRRVDEEHVVRLTEKLAEQGLLAGTEHKAPPRSNPLLALRWKVLVTNPQVTKRLTAPFTFLFRPWVMVPLLAAFAGVFWFVLIHKGVASATSQAFRSPGLLLLVFVLAVLSAGFHEMGHASACRYGGATPAGMGMGLYLVWPAFYTDVTDAYRLPKRDRLRVDLGGLYFNAVVSVITMGVWLLLHVDALLLLVGLQVLEMVKQLSPVIRADGYHILADATGVPDLYSQMGPTLRRLLPWHRREPSALTGRARLVVTLWVLIIVPILLSLSLSAILLLPKLATSAWDSGHHIAVGMPHQVANVQILDLVSSLVRLLALALPVVGSALVTQRVVRSLVRKARAWSAGEPVRRVAVLVASSAIIAGLAWAWWPSGQYQPVPNHGGTLAGLGQLVAQPVAVARPSAQPPQVQLTPGRHLAMAMIPVGGATKRHPALFIITGGKGGKPVAIVSGSTPKLGGGTVTGTPARGGGSTTPTSTGTSAAGSTSASPTTGGTTSAPSPTAPATAFPFTLPSAPGPGGTQALSVNTKDGGVLYDVAYTLVTVDKGAPVTNTNSAFAIASCKGCTTVAVSFQVVLIVGRSKLIAPINAAGSLNYNCPACTTTAIADQLVVTLTAQPPQALAAKLNADLKQLDALSALGANGTPAVITTQVGVVQQEIVAELNNSGLLAHPITSGSPSSTTSNPSSTNASGGSSATSGSGGSTGQTTSSPSSATPAPGASTTTSTTTAAGSTSSPTTTTTTTSSSTTTSTTPAASANPAAAPSGTTTAPTG
jgi:putative peptide zinc metalloprotease protein